MSINTNHSVYLCKYTRDESKRISRVPDIILPDNSHWILHDKFTNNHGLTILKPTSM